MELKTAGRLLELKTAGRLLELKTVRVWLRLVLVLGLRLGEVFGLGLDYELGFSSDIRLRQDP